MGMVYDVLGIKRTTRLGKNYDDNIKCAIQANANKLEPNYVAKPNVYGCPACYDPEALAAYREQYCVIYAQGGDPATNRELS